MVSEQNRWLSASSHSRPASRSSVCSSCRDPASPQKAHHRTTSDVGRMPRDPASLKKGSHRASSDVGRMPRSSLRRTFIAPRRNPSTSPPRPPLVESDSDDNGFVVIHPPGPPSDQNLPEAHPKPPSGGFGCASMVTGGKISFPTQSTANRLPTPIPPHAQEKQEVYIPLKSKPLLPTPADSETPAWKRLTSRSLPPPEVISLIKAIFTNRDEVEVICDLRGDDAQSFIDAIHKVRFVFFPSFGGTI